MPIYEYRCPGCGHDFEKLVKLNAPPPSCPECGREDVEKKVSAAGFILKGSGWYKDHYGLKSSSKSSSGKDGSSGGSSKKESGGASSSNSTSSSGSSASSSSGSAAS